MEERFDLAVTGGLLALPGGIAEGDLGIRAGRIARIGRVPAAAAEQVLDARGLVVLPGIIDSQVHFREPGLTHKEDLESGTRAAILGGVTAIMEMPNTDPLTTSAELLADKFTRAQGRAWTDHGFFVGATADNVEQLPVLERFPGVPGVKIFMGSSTGSLLVADDPTLARVLSHGRRRFAVHAEDEAMLRERRGLIAEGASPALHPFWRDEASALSATRRIVALARAAGRPVHVLHVTTAEEMEFLAEHKDIASVEVTPQHLTLTAPDCYERHGTWAQMNPPIRGARHQDALWQAVREGLVDVIGSDHAPHTAKEKARPYPASPSGIPGVQTLLPLMLDHVAAGRLGLMRLVDLVCHGPARLFGLCAKGRLGRGFDADLVLVDRAAERVIEADWLASRAGWSPFIGHRVTGWPIATVLAGRVVMRDGDLFGPPAGRPLRFAG